MKLYVLFDGFALGVVVHRFDFIGPAFTLGQRKQRVVIAGFFAGTERQQTAQKKKSRKHGHFSGT